MDEAREFSRQKLIDAMVKQAREDAQGALLFGHEVDPNDDKELIALLCAVQLYGAGSINHLKEIQVQHGAK